MFDDQPEAIMDSGLCRTCLDKSSELHPISSVHSVDLEELRLDFVIGTVTNLQMVENEGLPSEICSPCKDNAITAFLFKKRANEADSILRKLFHKEKPGFSSDVAGQNNGQTVENLQVKIELEPAGMDDDLDFGSPPNSPLNQDGNASDIRDEDDEPIATLKLPKKPNNHHSKSEKKIAKTKKHINKMKKKNKIVKKTFKEIEKVTKLNEKDTFKMKKVNHPIKSDEVKEDDIVKAEYNETSTCYCPVCGTCYANARSLSAHMRSAHQNVMRTSGQREMMTASKLMTLSDNGVVLKPMKASRIQVKQETYPCIICGLELLLKSELATHLDTHKDTKFYVCTLCQSAFLKKNIFDNHSCMANGNEDETDDNNAQPPIGSHMGVLSLQEIIDASGVQNSLWELCACSTCRAVFASSAELERHVDAVHPHLSLHCNICKRRFVSLRAASIHRQTCKEVELQFGCSSCGMRYSQEVALNKHILRFHRGQLASTSFIKKPKHSGEKNHQCATCKKKFYTEELMVEHSKIHTMEKKFQCSLCPKRFHRKDNLRSHQRTHESRAPPPRSHLCLHCGRAFSSSSNLVVHVRRHTGEKPYTCDFCGKGFPRSSDLCVHRRSHTGERPCTCRVCGKGFSRSHMLTLHMRVHTGVRPYKCSFCGRAFAQRNDLTIHVRRHTGDKPYVCDVCGDRFIQNTALQNHRRTQGHLPPPGAEPSVTRTVVGPLALAPDAPTNAPS